MLFELFCYVAVILAVLFVMAPQNHKDSYTGRPSAIEVEVLTIEYEEEMVTLVWPHQEAQDNEIYDYEYSTCEVQWSFDEPKSLEIEDPWMNDTVLPTLMRKKEAYEESHTVLLLAAAKEPNKVNPSIPTTKKGFTPKKSSPKKNKKGAKKK